MGVRVSTKGEEYGVKLPPADIKTIKGLAELHKGIKTTIEGNTFIARAAYEKSSKVLFIRNVYLIVEEVGWTIKPTINEQNFKSEKWNKFIEEATPMLIRFNSTAASTAAKSFIKHVFSKNVDFDRCIWISKDMMEDVVNISLLFDYYSFRDYLEFHSMVNEEEE